MKARKHRRAPKRQFHSALKRILRRVPRQPDAERRCKTHTVSVAEASKQVVAEHREAERLFTGIADTVDRYRRGLLCRGSYRMHVRSLRDIAETRGVGRLVDGLLTDAGLRL